MGDCFYCSKAEPVVQTKAGKIRGFKMNSTYTFHGIKYADADRFQMPREVKPWKGIKNALAYGYVCPMLMQDHPLMEVMIPHRYWPMDENCQYLNIWTQSLDPEAKKPVMVWLHGGGFFAGSSIEQVAYEGEHLSEYGDVVVVSLNHRLNILGYLDLSAYGEKYYNSANVGNADMVAALHWIQDNIAGFGGDPGNVTLFGQSGGGMKVYSLMNTPAAEGLFHKGIIQSGVIEEGKKEAGDDGTAIVEALLTELKLESVEDLETIPYYFLAEAYNKVSPKLQEKGLYVGGEPRANSWYAGDPRRVGFTDGAKKIPVIVGSVFGEFDFKPVLENRDELTREETMKLLEKCFQEDAEEIAAEFEKAYPNNRLVDVLSLDYIFRYASKDFIAKKSVHKEAPVYSYMFNYEFPYEGGKLAWHCSEIPFVFHNIDRIPICNVPGETDRLQERICGAWINFARYGNPSVPSLPQWSVCEPGKEAIMIFDNICEVKDNYDHRLMELLVKHAPAFTVPLDEDAENVFMH